MKYEEVQDVVCFGKVIVVAAIALIIGVLIGLSLAKHGQKRVEQAQEKIRLDIKEIRQRGELAEIINGFFRERNRIIDWNKSHIVLTVEPDSEGNQ